MSLDGYEQGKAIHEARQIRRGVLILLALLLCVIGACGGTVAPGWWMLPVALIAFGALWASEYA